MSTYHQRIAEQKRAAILDAATGLFLAAGYDGTSLAKIAEAAGVSKATLFKQFPTKAALFDAIVTESWQVEDAGGPELPLDDLEAGLTAIGRRYVELLTRPGMTALFRIVIAELPRFPELGEAQFSRGKMPYFESVRSYLSDAKIDDPEMAATQFLGMISNFVFWPSLLLTDWAPGAAANEKAVTEAVRTMIARYH
ncbi:TetR/AcrR family transcriptional regulator [Paractinoplanes atraurantiacus]|uniref:DNA-binding transcriptional regulator, AcrR family n=1 Tax=Paractinoplanes atraurantiacus TaxID=1036182 RepID=A0A285F0F5_9ACTN|nr:TetR/AcrR family transcriptional regulator [Actinoplanes atraurantiacus]SNY04767.1 DNA-binding transcriptional regulator, AcrR family [Actinoplanes atraurantiacus]